jgi:hypothetical protein
MPLKPRPVTFTATTSAAYKGAGKPSNVVVVNGATAGSAILPVKQAGIADIANSGVLADLAAAQTAINADRAKINAIISALEAAGILVTV